MSSLKPSKYIDLQPFQAWVQQSLPAVYDDSLSYTDLLAKMLAYLNNLVANNNTLSTDVTNAINYINTFFESTDFQDKVDDKLNRMAEDGSLSRLIQPLFDAYKVQIDEDFAKFKNQTNKTVATQNSSIANFINQTNQTVATQNSSIDNIQSQQNTLKQRMDTFTQLPSGSTSGDAELQDIRVGANGITYNTAGDAVRGQYSQLNKDLVDTKQILNVLDVRNANVTPFNATYENLLFTQTGLFPRFYGLIKNKKYRIVIKTTKTNNISLKAFKAGEFLKTYVQYQNIDNNSKFITDIFWEYDNSEVGLCVANETTSDLSPMYIGIYDITDLNNNQISMINEPVTLLQKYNLLTWYQNKKLTALGDSVTEQARYLNFLKDILYFNTIQNCGEGGTTVAGTSPHAMNNDERINKMDNDSDVVLFMGGINDWVQNIQLGAIDDTDVSTFYGALNNIAEKLTNKYPTKLVVFMGTTYAIYHGNQFSEDGLKNANGSTTKDYSDCIMNVAKKYGIPFVDLYGNCGWNKFNIDSFVTNDGAYLHPNENGGKRMGRIIYSKLIEVMPSDYIN